jgi:two-component system, LuxR family, response regulator FixJ
MLMNSPALLAVIDDHDEVRLSLRALLEAMGYQVRDFASAHAFLESGAEADCIIADIRMPRMSGLELQDELARRKSAIPLILITGHADVAIAVTAMRAGAYDFMEKPVDDERLLESVKGALSEGQQARHTARERSDAAQAISNLTTREREVLDRLVMGMSNKLVAYELGISPRTVETHRARLQTKLKARDLSYLVRLCMVAGEMH